MESWTVTQTTEHWETDINTDGHSHKNNNSEPPATSKKDGKDEDD